MNGSLSLQPTQHSILNTHHLLMLNILESFFLSLSFCFFPDVVLGRGMNVKIVHHLCEQGSKRSCTKKLSSSFNHIQNFFFYSVVVSNIGGLGSIHIMLGLSACHWHHVLRVQEGKEVNIFVYRVSVTAQLRLNRVEQVIINFI